MEYKIRVEETRTAVLTVCLEADSFDEAAGKAEYLYNNFDIAFEWPDYEAVAPSQVTFTEEKEEAE